MTTNILIILMAIFITVILIFGAILFCSLDDYSKRIRKIYNKVTDIIELYENYFNTEKDDETPEEIIEIKYFADIDKIEKINKGDWIDLRAAEDVVIKAGEYKLISLGVGMKLPEGYEAIVAPRSSTYKNFKIRQTNSFGIIDNSYCGEKDVWKYPCVADEDTIIHKNDRICQFRIIENQPPIQFVTVEHLDDKDRGGFGTTGKQ